MSDAALPSPSQKSARFWTRASTLQKIYFLVLPTTLLIALLGYYPKFDVIIKSLYRWNGSDVEEYIGLKNFKDAFADPLFWKSFQLVFIMLVANLLKMWPGIFAAVALHRINSNKLRYIFQVSFVVPMVIPGMVWLLIWKSFYDPEFGIFNKILNSTGLMSVLNKLDNAMPQLATQLEPFVLGTLRPLFGGVSGLVLLGIFIFMAAYHGPDKQVRFKAAGLILGTAFLVFVAEQIMAGSKNLSLGPFGAVVLFIFCILMYFLAKTLGPRWVLWMFITFAGLYVFRPITTEGHGNNLLLFAGIKTAYFRFFIWTAFALVLSEIIRSLQERFASETTLRIIGVTIFLIGAGLAIASSFWTYPTNQFSSGTPAWLGSKDLVIPALIFWGFPWVGTVGVLIYLAGLQQIPIDVYEAAELDGIGPIGMLFRIELPLILTQVRINLIFMTIGTLTTYEMFLILLGPNGGPDNRGMVPGLYIFSKAFLEGKFGYGCALGMVLFFMILGLTVIYNKYVKVDK
jgi:ABC-type sugar transport system permease subunit